MATSTEARIMALLFARLGTLTGAAAALPIAWPNVSFTQPASGKFLSVDFIPNRVDRLFIGSNEQHQMRGLLQVSVMWPLDVGTGAPLDIAGDIVAAYPVDFPLWDGDLKASVYQRPAIAGPIIDPPNLRTPVTVAWQAIV